MKVICIACSQPIDNDQIINIIGSPTTIEDNRGFEFKYDTEKSNQSPAVIHYGCLKSHISGVDKFIEDTNRGQVDNVNSCEKKNQSENSSNSGLDLIKDYIRSIDPTASLSGIKKFYEEHKNNGIDNWSTDKVIDTWWFSNRQEAE